MPSWPNWPKPKFPPWRPSPSTAARCTNTKASASRFFRAAADGRRNSTIRRCSAGWGAFSDASTPSARKNPFVHRPDLTIQNFGEAPRDELLKSPFLPPELRDTWLSVVNQALDGVRRCFDRAGALPSIRLHGDVHSGNVLWTDAGPHFVDFDDARNGPAIQDLWMLLSGDAQAMARQFDHVLEGYEQFADFNPASLHLVEALRTLRLIHYAGWIAKRWIDPAFPAAFGWFDTPRYWQDMILALREQVALMDESPLARQF